MIWGVLLGKSTTFHKDLIQVQGHIQLFMLKLYILHIIFSLLNVTYKHIGQIHDFCPSLLLFSYEKFLPTRLQFHTLSIAPLHTAQNQVSELYLIFAFLDSSLSNFLGCGIFIHMHCPNFLRTTSCADYPLSTIRKCREKKKILFHHLVISQIPHGFSPTTYMSMPFSFLFMSSGP